MFHVEDKSVKELLLTGNFGLERESLRIDGQGFLAHTPHPFSPEHRHIVRDFCENQTEINTPVTSTAEDVLKYLALYDREIKERLRQIRPQEYLWPFSNPPYIRSEEDVPVATFSGDLASKTQYRHYLSNRYGRYRMTFSGIHLNYSFSGELLRRNYEAETGLRIKKEQTDEAYRLYLDELYLNLAERLVAYGWLLVSLTAASPVLDSSFYEKGRCGEDVFTGKGSVRCCEEGYWNAFAAVLDYSGIQAYADSIQRYVDKGWIAAPSELYFPIRLKPSGLNLLETLRQNGVNHIEFRMIDLNPLTPSGIHLQDVKFFQLFVAFLASQPRQGLSSQHQVQAIANYKNAARYDLDNVKVVLPNGQVNTVAEAGRRIISFMRTFYQDYPAWVKEVLNFQEDKLIHPEHRYAWQVRERFSANFVEKGMEAAKQKSVEQLNV